MTSNEFADMQEFVVRLQDDLDRYGLLPAGSAALIAVSGGVDSMVLLHGLHSLAGKNRWRLRVAHFNHGLRGRESRADEALVCKTAAELGLECYRGCGEVHQLHVQSRLSLEMAARRMRHAFLAETAERYDLSRIALAHHADDQLELFFIRLLRGTSSAGLAGMRWANPSPQNPRVQLIRPLLGQNKAQLRAHARLAGIAFREDRSNRSLDPIRNRVRLELLPLLRRQFQPNLDDVLARTMAQLGDESDLLRETAARWLAETNRSCFDSLAPAIQRYCIRLQLESLGATVNYARIEHFRLHPERPLTLSPDLTLTRHHDGRVVRCGIEQVAFDGQFVDLELQGDRGECDFDGWKFEWEILPGSERPPSNDRVEYFDADRIGTCIRLRHWQRGDRFHPIGFATNLKLQDWFTNSKVPRAQRHGLILAEAVERGLFWVQSMRVSELFKLDTDTRRRLKWTWSWQQEVASSDTVSSAAHRSAR